MDLTPKHLRPLVLLAVAAITFVSCRATESSPPATAAAPASTPAATASTAPASPSAQAEPSAAATAEAFPQGGDPVTLDPADFTADIDNPFFPMVAGTRWTYRETDSEGQTLKVVVVATTKTKLLANGITARVVRDTVSLEGAIVEDTFDWYAQDAQGNVWYMGEDTAEFEDGKVSTTAGSFQAGVDGALPGIAMPADPQPGMKYRQEYYQGEAEDNAEVLSTAEMAEVPLGHYDDVLLTKETVTIEPDALEYKLYGRGIGELLALDVSGGSGRQELLKVDQAPEGAGTGPLGSPNP
jgi:hypothetical protein